MAERDWRLHCSPYTQTCNECGRSVVPWEECMFDMKSGHIVRHTECHQKAEERRAQKERT